MTVLHIFSVKDTKADAWITPFMLPTKEMAIRTFSQACTDPDHQFGTFPQDFALSYLGEFDPINGKFKTNDPQLVLLGLEAKKQFLRTYSIHSDSMDDIEIKKVG